MGMVLTLVAGLPYLHVLWRLSGRNPAKGLRLAALTAVGGIIILPAALVLAGPDANPKESWQWTGAALIALSQVLLMALAIKANAAVKSSERNFKSWALSAIPPTIYFLVCLPVLFAADFWLFPPRQLKPADESPVVAFMTFRVMEVEYAATHLNSYMPDLKALGAVGLPQLKGYEFTYTAGLPGGDGIIRSYTLIARPSEPCPGHCSCSFFMDETGVVRITKENRPATADDPPLTPDERMGRGVGAQM